MPSEDEDLNEDLKHVAFKQLIVFGFMVVAVVVAAWVERQASSPDPVPPQAKRWWEDRQRQRDADREWASRVKHLFFEAYELLGPGSFDPTDVDR